MRALRNRLEHKTYTFLNEERKIQYSADRQRKVKDETLVPKERLRGNHAGDPVGETERDGRSNFEHNRSKGGRCSQKPPRLTDSNNKKIIIKTFPVKLLSGTGIRMGNKIA